MGSLKLVYVIRTFIPIKLLTNLFLIMQCLKLSQIPIQVSNQKPNSRRVTNMPSIPDFVICDADMQRARGMVSIASITL
jgi:hypothetical protein